MIGLSLPAPPSSMHDFVSHLWPLIGLILILMLGKRFFRKRRKLQISIILCFIPLVIWGPLLFQQLDGALGYPKGNVYSYMRYEYRTFTNHEGKEIEAAILDVFGDQVKIRRAIEVEGEAKNEMGEGEKIYKDYVNSISDYSPEDQEYIRKWKSRR